MMARSDISTRQARYIDADFLPPSTFPLQSDGGPYILGTTTLHGLFEIVLEKDLRLTLKLLEVRRIADCEFYQVVLIVSDHHFQVVASQKKVPEVSKEPNSTKNHSADEYLCEQRGHEPLRNSVKVPPLGPDDE
jgi:hypothetical protein